MSWGSCLRRELKRMAMLVGNGEQRVKQAHAVRVALMREVFET